MEYIYTKENHSVWRQLIDQQTPLVRKYACPEYLEGLKKIDFPNELIPSLKYVSEKLSTLTGWSLVPADQIIPCSNFFSLLAEKKFPIIRKIRSYKEIDFYTNESPDIFHEYFGHCPLLTDQNYADSLQKFGMLAKGQNKFITHILDKIFWATFEFGIIKNHREVMVYGAGILPSRTELKRVIEGNFFNSVTFKVLDIYEDLDSSLQGNINQQTFYYLDSMNELFRIVKEDLPKLVNDLTLQLSAVGS